MDSAVLDKLNNQQSLDDLNFLAEDILVHDLIGSAQQMISVIEGLMARFPDLKKNAPEAFPIYLNSLQKAKFVCLFDLNEKEILSLLKEKFDIPLAHLDVYDLQRKLSFKLQSIPDLSARDEFKEKIKENFLACQLRLSDNKIKTGNSLEEPTVANWIKNYYTQVGLDSADSFEQSEYLSTNENVKKLKPEQREKLKYLINIIEKLKLSSEQVGGLEESFPAISPIGELNLISHGLVEKINPDIIKTYNQVVSGEGKAPSFSQIIASVPVTSSTPTPAAIPSPLAPSSSNPIAPAATASRPAESAPAPTDPAAGLETLLKNYPPDTLEYKAVKEEIARQKKINAKK